MLESATAIEALEPPIRLAQRAERLAVAPDATALEASGTTRKVAPRPGAAPPIGGARRKSSQVLLAAERSCSLYCGNAAALSAQRAVMLTASVDAEGAPTAPPEAAASGQVSDVAFAPAVPAKGWKG